MNKYTDLERVINQLSRTLIQQQRDKVVALFMSWNIRDWDKLLLPNDSEQWPYTIGGIGVCAVSVTNPAPTWELILDTSSIGSKQAPSTVTSGKMLLFKLRAWHKNIEKVSTPVKVKKRPAPGFFTNNREAVMTTILALGDRLCCYGGSTWLTRRCDCKYGLQSHTPGGGETTGCPELRCVYYLLEHMTDEEWNSRMLSE
jgi:hypothetical protein